MQATGQRVVITGAGSGLGRELALRYAREGARLALADINDDGLEETRRLATATGGWAFTQRCDVRDFSQLAALAQSCDERLNGVDVLINNAGIASGGLFWDLSLEDWDSQICINLMGVVKGCKAFMPLFMRQGAGRIINIASMAAHIQTPGMSNYNVAKAGVVALSESLLAELHPLGIKVNVVCPSFFQTNLLASYHGPDTQARDDMAKLLENSPISAADVADITYRESEADQFMILPHERGRLALEQKRADPQVIYDEMVRLAAKRVSVN